MTQLCITEFRKYPYLAVHTAEAYEDYFALMFTEQDSVVVAAYCNNTLVGFLTGTNFCDYMKHLELFAPFQDSTLNLAACYYGAELIIVPEHRGNHLCTQFRETLEKYARSRSYQMIAGITEEHETHPLKPADYIDPGSMLRHFGFQRSETTASISWPTVQLDGSVQEQAHVLTYWFKNLSRAYNKP